MPRVQRIFIVVNQAAKTTEEAIVATFTVKHEMLAWLDRRIEHDDFDDFEVYYSRDGLFQDSGVRRLER